MSDGYLLEQRLDEMQSLLNDQDTINKELLDMSEDISNSSQIPNNIDSWLDSVPEIGKESFKLSDFKKMFKMQRKYNDLLEKRTINSGKIKVIVIDNIIERIKKVIEN